MNDEWLICPSHFAQILCVFFASVNYFSKKYFEKLDLFGFSSGWGYDQFVLNSEMYQDFLIWIGWPYKPQESMSVTTKTQII